MKFLSIIQLTFRESFAKETFIAFMLISTLISALFLFAVNLDIVNGMQTSLKIFGADARELIEIKQFLFEVQGGIIVMLYTGGIFMALFATSSLIPTLLQPGFIDLFICKPISRPAILLGRYLGALVIVAFNIFYLVLTSWLILSIKTGFWNLGYLYAALVILLAFSALYSLMTLLSITSRSGALSLMITYLVLFFSPLLLQRDNIYALLSSKFWGIAIDWIYYALPKTSELGGVARHVAKGVPVVSWFPVWTTALFTVVVFGLAAVIFNKKDY